MRKIITVSLGFSGLLAAVLLLALPLGVRTVVFWLALVAGCEKPEPKPKAALSNMLEIRSGTFATTKEGLTLVSHLGWHTGAVILKCGGFPTKPAENIMLKYQIELWSKGQLIKSQSFEGCGVAFPFEREMTISLQEIEKHDVTFKYKIALSITGPAETDVSGSTISSRMSSPWSIEGPCISGASSEDIQHNNVLHVEPTKKTAIWAYAVERKEGDSPGGQEDYIDDLARHSGGAIVLRVWLGTLNS